MSTGVGNTRLVSLNGAIDDETLGVAFDASLYVYITAYIIGTGTTSSGVITFEEADWNPNTDTPYSGTWSSIATANASDVTAGAQKGVHFTVSAYHWVRARVSTAIGGGGSIRVVFVGVGSS